MHKKLLKYILFCLVMIISIVLILNVVRHNTDEELNSSTITSEYETKVSEITDTDHENPDNPIDLSFVNENVGWAVESNGYASYIVKTTDGGKNWLNISSYNGDIIKIFFLDTLNGWAVTQSNTSNSTEYLFLKTEDGGKTFQVIYKKIIESISLIQINYQTTDLIFFDKNNGYVMLSGKLLKTTDGGQRWSVINPNIPDFNMTEMCFINVNVGWVGGSVAVNKDINKDAADAYIYCTTDGGNNWSNQFQVSSSNNNYQITHNYQINGISFIDNQYGWFLIENITDLHTELYRTVDGGKTFTEVSSNNLYLAGPNFSHILFLDEDIGFISYKTGGGSTQGGIYKTDDGGKTFKNLSNTSLNGNIIASGDILFITPSNGYVICPTLHDGNFIIKTTDQGNTWDQILPVSKY